MIFRAVAINVSFRNFTVANLHHQLSRWNQVIFWRSIKVLHHLTFTFKTLSCWFTRISFDDTKKLSVKILSNSFLLNKVSIFPKRKLTFTYFEIECFRGFSVGYQRQSTYVSWRNLLSKNKKKFPSLISFQSWPSKNPAATHPQGTAEDCVHCTSVFVR